MLAAHALGEANRDFVSKRPLKWVTDAALSQVQPPAAVIAMHLYRAQWIRLLERPRPYRDIDAIFTTQDLVRKRRPAAM